MMLRPWLPLNASSAPSAGNGACSGNSIADETWPRPTSAPRHRRRACAVVAVRSWSTVHEGRPPAKRRPWRFRSSVSLRSAGGRDPSVVENDVPITIEIGACWSRGSECGATPPSKTTTRLPSWLNSARATPTLTVSAAAAASASRIALFPARISGEPVRLDQAVVEAEADHDVVGQLAVSVEPDRIALSLVEVAMLERGRRLSQICDLESEIAHPGGQGRRVGGGLLPGLHLVQ